MNILVTGAAGFIGSNLLPELLKKKNKVYLVLRKKTNTWRIKKIIKKCRVYYIDNLDNVEKVFSENHIDLIIHLATNYVKNDKDIVNRDLMIKSNVDFPTLLLKYAIKYKVSMFLNTGTCFEYELLDRPLREDDKIKPYNFYAKTKVIFEQKLKKIADIHQIKAVTLKLFYLYGKNETNKIVYKMIESFLLKKTLFVPNGNQKFNFTYIDDIVNGFLKAIIFLDKEYKSYESFNIGENKVFSLKKISKILEKIINKKSNITFTKETLKDDLIYVNCSNKAAKNKLKWKPNVKIEEGLKRTFKFNKKILNHKL